MHEANLSDNVIAYRKLFDVKCDTIRDELAIIMGETITGQVNGILKTLATQQYRAINGTVPTK